MIRDPRPFVVITRKSLAADAARRWLVQYSDGSNSTVHRALVALGPSPDPDDVDRAIGNGSWTVTYCDHCGAEGVPVVELGQEPDYESSTARVCRACLVDALAAVEAAP